MDKNIKFKSKKAQAEYNKLSKGEKRTYFFIKNFFPKTSHDCCMDFAINGGTNLRNKKRLLKTVRPKKKKKK